jgi:hypothetical protein
MSEEVYTVERILDKRKTLTGTLEYLIKWDGYENDESTWESIHKLRNVMDLVQDYENELKRKYTERLLKPKSIVEDGNAGYEVRTEIGDLVPETVSTVKEIGGVLHALVTWEAGSDGTLQDAFFVPSHVIADTYPKKLIEFYEKKIKFVNKK